MSRTSLSTTPPERQMLDIKNIMSPDRRPGSASSAKLQKSEAEAELKRKLVDKSEQLRLLQGGCREVGLH